MPKSTTRLGIGICIGVVLLLAIFYAKWWPDAPMVPPSPAAPDMTEVLAHNARGIGHLEQFEYDSAVQEFRQVVQLAPDWLPGKINLGIALLNTAKDEPLAEAIRLFREVLAQDPNNLHANYCLGIIYLHQNQLEAAHPLFRKVTELAPNDGHGWYHFGLTHPEGTSSPATLAAYEKALKLNPYLNAARYGLAHHPQLNDPQRKQQLLAEHKRLIDANWEQEYEIVYSRMGRLADAIGRSPRDQRNAGFGPLPLFDVWKDFRIDLPPGVRWANASDLDRPTQQLRHRFGPSMVAFDFNRDGKTDVLMLAAVVDNGRVRDVLLRNEGNGVFVDVSPSAFQGQLGSHWGVAIGDFDNDGFPDVCLTGFNTVELWRNRGDSTLENVSEAAGLTALRGVLRSPTWVDLDQDGDLDLLLARFADQLTDIDQHQPPVTVGVEVLLNVGVAKPVRPNEDQGGLRVAFRRVQPNGPDSVSKALFVAESVIGFAILDIDNDRDMDILVVPASGSPIVMFNDRLLRFHRGTLAAGEWSQSWLGGLAFDLNHDENLDLFAVRTNADSAALTANTTEAKDSVAWTYREQPLRGLTLRSVCAVDIDLDGWMDLVATTTDGKVVLLHNQAEKLVASAEAFGPIPRAIAALPLDGTGDAFADLWLWPEAGSPLVVRNLGNGHHAVIVEPTGKRNVGSNLRTNADALGTRVTVHARASVSMVELGSSSVSLGQGKAPIVIGIGPANQADVVRLRWPDGVPQAELQQPADQRLRIAEINRKGTSCPILFAWDGERFRYVTDCLGAGALGERTPDGGLRLPRPEESIYLGTWLRPRNGAFEVWLSEPMDEVLYLDRLELCVVDHPAAMLVLPDERFATTQPGPTQALLPLQEVWFPHQVRDHRGRDVTELLRHRDGKYVDGFARRSWLGYAEEHWIEFDGGETWPCKDRSARWVLCLAGWTDYPYPESIFAATQAGVPLRPPILEARQADGRWKILGELGFPAGLPRLMTIEITDWLRGQTGPFRIRTNMQIEWDQLFLARRDSDSALRIHRLTPIKAELTTTGFFQEIRQGTGALIGYDPERTEPVSVSRWQGRLTRLGTVTELLTQTDDCFVLCGPGETISARFDASALPPLAEGQTRSYILRAWGYCKDVAPFTASGGEVGPLPFRGMKQYPYPPSERQHAPPQQDAYDRQWNTRTLGSKKRD